jgi:hypothetical protein
VEDTYIASVWFPQKIQSGNHQQARECTSSARGARAERAEAAGLYCSSLSSVTFPKLWKPKHPQLLVRESVLFIGAVDTSSASLTLSLHVQPSGTRSGLSVPARNSARAKALPVLSVHEL